MSHKVWDLTTKEELLTVLWAILTVLLFISEIKLFYYMGWLSGAWTAICFINIIKSVWPNSFDDRKFEDIISIAKVQAYLRKKLLTPNFMTAGHEKQEEIIKEIACTVYDNMKRMYEKG